MDQIAKLLSDPVDGFLRHARYLIIDRDSKFTAKFRAILKDAGGRAVLIPASPPNCNSLAERWILSTKTEVLNRMIVFGTGSLDRALAAYEAHYAAERNHQALENAIIDPEPGVGSAVGVVRRRERLGGLLSYYHRAAA